MRLHKIVLLVLACLLVVAVQVSVAALKKDVVKLWTYPVHQKYDKELAGLVQRFEELNPGIQVEYEFLAWNDGPQKFEIALNAGDPPDVYWCNPEPKYLKTGLLVPMDEYLTPDEKADYCQVTLKGFVIDGKLCGIPLYAGIWTFGGNRELLEAAKIDWRSVQRTGWTWDEFFEAAKKLTKKLPDGRTQYGFVMPGYNAELWEFLMLNNNAPQIVSPEGELLWTQEKVAEALRFVRKLMDSGVMPREVVGMSATKRWELFNSWDAAMFGRGIPYFEILCLQRRQDIADGKVSGRPIDYISLPIPHKEGAPQRTYARVAGYSLFKQRRYRGDAHTSSAAKLLKFLTGPEAGGAAVELAYQPVSKKGQQMFKSKIDQLRPENVAFMESQLDHIEWAPALSVELGTKDTRIRSEVVIPVYQAVLAYEMSPEEAASVFVQRAIRILQK